MDVAQLRDLAGRSGSGLSEDATMLRNDGLIEAIKSSAGTCPLRCFQIVIGSVDRDAW